MDKNWCIEDFELPCLISNRQCKMQIMRVLINVAKKYFHNIWTLNSISREILREEYIFNKWHILWWEYYFHYLPSSIINEGVRKKLSINTDPKVSFQKTLKTLISLNFSLQSSAFSLVSFYSVCYDLASLHLSLSSFSFSISHQTWKNG